MEIECVGKKIGDDQILIDLSLIERAKIGSTIKLKNTVPDQKETRGKKELSPATKRLLKRSTILFIPEDIPSLYSPGHNVLEKAGDVKSGLAGHGFYSLTEFTGITEKYMIVQRP